MRKVTDDLRPLDNLFVAMSLAKMQADIEDCPLGFHVFYRAFIGMATAMVVSCEQLNIPLDDNVHKMQEELVTLIAETIRKYATTPTLKDAPVDSILKSEFDTEAN